MEKTERRNCAIKKIRSIFDFNKIPSPKHIYINAEMQTNSSRHSSYLETKILRTTLKM